METVRTNATVLTSFIPPLFLDAIKIHTCSTKLDAQDTVVTAVSIFQQCVPCTEIIWTISLSKMVSS